ncbi:MAG: hypothetical protein LBE91_03565 [Tannerella sp.]|jgi:hypothetical protein|nr:hypothetical protein [Tannerella sp.]
MKKIDLKQFVRDYIEAWSTANAGERKQLIGKLYAESADFYANEPGDDAMERHGQEEIFANITQVNERLVVNNGLLTECIGYSINHNTLKISWLMKTPNGDVAMRGMNFLLLDASGKIAKDYIFIG